MFMVSTCSTFRNCTANKTFDSTSLDGNAILFGAARTDQKQKYLKYKMPLTKRNKVTSSTKIQDPFITFAFISDSPLFSRVTPFNVVLWLGWGPMPGKLGPMAMGGPAVNRSLHELGKAYLRSPHFHMKSSKNIYCQVARFSTVLQI